MKKNNRELHRYLFLQFDGVLCTIRNRKYLFDNKKEKDDEFGDFFDPETIENLNYIIKKVPDLKIIITSPLRLNGWDWMNKMWIKRELPGKIYSLTPKVEEVYYSDKINRRKTSSKYSYETRGLEIREWLEQNVKEGTSYFYAILDDEYELLARQLHYLVPSDIQNGLTRELADKVIEKLHIDYEDEINNHIINFDHMPLSNDTPAFLDVIIYEDGRTNLRKQINTTSIEIERKYLVINDSYKEKAYDHSRIQQGYISNDNGKVVRVRIRDNQAYITIKGPTSEGGLKCLEIEKEITLDEGKLLMEICELGLIDKERWLVYYQGHTFEIDEFFGDNEGLVMAEVELSSEEEWVELPEFIGKEVTGNKRYFNNQLRQHPYCKWK